MIVTRDRACVLLQSGSLLTLTHRPEGDEYWLEPGGLVDPDLARAVIVDFELEPRKDSLLDDEKPQTWSLR